MSKLTIRDVDLNGKKVLVRVDYNVPLDKSQNITDDTRIKESLPTIKYLLEKNCRIILCSHLGRPKGKVAPEFSLKPVAKRLSELLEQEIKFAPDCIGDEVKKLAGGLKPKEILLLENLRFHSEEEKNDEGFAKQLSELGEFFVQDAFGTVHRAHASTAGVNKFLPSAAGFLLEKEIKYLGDALENPARPFVAILG
ncbi:MAG TPA: phosphoglycerate kinase, partial [Elusimicrobia bacterium]|nr:phosphoglycerate kinase [Elusimicrobiota bacterium]